LNEPTNSTSQPGGNELAKKTIHGIGWNYATFGLGKILSLITTAILARLLTPDNFGIVAYVTVAITYLTLLKDMGLGAALVQRREDVEKTANTVFTLNLGVGVFITLLTMLIAPLAADYFREPLVTPMLRWLGLSILLNSLGSVHMSRLKREMQFHWKMIPQISNILVKALVSIILALFHYGAWALIIGQLAGSLVSMILVWKIVPWRPKLMIDRTLTRSLFRFGVFIMGEDALSIGQDNFDYLVIGRLFSSVSMGIYTLAFQLPEMLILSLFWVIADVLFPAFASIQDQREKLVQGVLSTIRYLELVITPLALGLCVAADPIIRVVFGEQWLDAIPIMQILAIYALVQSIGFNFGDVYKAIGKPEISIKITVPVMIFRLFALWVGAQFGLIYVAVAHLVSVIIEVIVRIIVATRVLKITFGDIAAQFTAFIAGGIMVVISVGALYLTNEMAPLARLVIIIACGAASYLGTVWFLEREAILRFAGMLGVKLPVKAK
jgi:PST family polysaccharide transporter